MQDRSLSHTLPPEYNPLDTRPCSRTRPPQEHNFQTPATWQEMSLRLGVQSGRSEDLEGRSHKCSVGVSDQNGQGPSTVDASMTQCVHLGHMPSTRLHQNETRDQHGMDVWWRVSPDGLLLLTVATWFFGGACFPDMSCLDTCHVVCPRSHTSYVICHVSNVMRRNLFVMCHMPSAICHMPCRVSDCMLCQFMRHVQRHVSCCIPCSVSHPAPCHPADSDLVSTATLRPSN